MAATHQVRLNVPNVLSAYRIAILPVIAWSILTGSRKLFFTLVCVSLVTDILDGWVARRFRMQTEFGARLDTFADNLTCYAAMVGISILDWPFVWEHRVAFGLLLLFNLAGTLLSLVKFRRPTALHLWSSKVTGYAQGMFVLTYFVIGYQAWYFYVMVVVSLAAYIEGFVIIFLMQEFRTNVRGLYWILRAEP